MINIGNGFVNSYIIKTDSLKYVLVDTAPSFLVNRWFLKLNKKISIDLLESVVLTHHHQDHTGGIYKLSKNISFDFYCHESAIKWLKSGENKKAFHYRKKLLKYFASGKKSPVLIDQLDNVKVHKVIDDIILPYTVDGENIKVINTKGHTKDSISVVVGDYAYVGDLITNVTKNNQMTFIYDDLDEIKCSLQKLKNIGVKYLFPGHGSKISIENIKLK